ncbi:hypothetical protein [uncultured Ruminococcus sp.]|uniref:hypothetical protein n=1 Tax=uncultured Ruminococcus sp. TaxID=165186 RepID=UPI0026175A39|nr:hypothetical protein [uncultured Ruminococcus sp.]
MGLFSKLLGEKSELGGLLKDVANVIKQESVNLHESEMTETAATYTDDVNTASGVGYGKSGFSWGPEMPAEENQFNFNGTYKEYFRDVFMNEFPQYSIVSADSNNGRATVFTFNLGVKKALVVELLSEKSSAYKLREECKREHIPYLRYYYDHHGWWNTRAYVAERTRKALEG